MRPEWTKNTIIVSILILIFISIGSGCQRQEALSDGQIAALRETYPATGLTGSEFMDKISPTMEEANKVVEFWAQVKCVGAAEDIYISSNPGNDDSAIAAIESKLGAEIPAEHHFICYEMEIIECFSGPKKAGDRFILMVEDFDLSVAPDFLNGKTWIVGTYHTHLSSLADLEELYLFYSDLTFYVTEDNYVLSVSGSENKADYSGITIREWEERLKIILK